MDLNIIANNLNDDCLSYIYSFVNRRQLCFEVLKKKHDTILTNHILRPTIKRFTEGKYYTEPHFLGHRVFRVVKLTKCFITIHYAKSTFEDREWVEIRMKRRYDKDDYEYFDNTSTNYTSSTNYKTKDVIELDKLPIVGRILYEKFNWMRERFRNDEYNYQWAGKVNDLIINPYEIKGDFDWLLIDLRKKKIVEYEDRVARAIQEAETRGIWVRQGAYEKEIGKLNDLNRLQIALYGEPPPPPTQSDIEYILQSETK